MINFDDLRKMDKEDLEKIVETNIIKYSELQDQILIKNQKLLMIPWLLHFLNRSNSLEKEIAEMRATQTNIILENIAISFVLIGKV